MHKLTESESDFMEIIKRTYGVISFLLHVPKIYPKSQAQCIQRNNAGYIKYDYMKIL